MSLFFKTILIGLIAINPLFPKRGLYSIDAKSKQSLRQKAIALQSLFNQSKRISDSSSIYAEKFFLTFPSEFREFYRLYEELDGNHQSPLCDVSYEHILLLDSTGRQQDTVFYSKIIKLCVGGKWEADAVNYLQNLLERRVEENVPLTTFVLKQMRDEQVKSFWYFYFSGPHRNARISPILSVINSIDKRVYKLLLLGRNKAIREWSEE